MTTLAAFALVFGIVIAVFGAGVVFGVCLSASTRANVDNDDLVGPPPWRRDKP